MIEELRSQLDEMVQARHIEMTYVVSSDNQNYDSQARRDQREFNNSMLFAVEMEREMEMLMKESPLKKKAKKQKIV
jgi:hypothetical protein